MLIPTVIEKSANSERAYDLYSRLLNDRIIFIDNGKVLLEDECQEILNNYGILKCSLEEFAKIDKDDIISYKKNKYNCEILINNRSKLKKKYKDFVVDKVTLEELMVLMIKGVKEC